MSHTAVMVELPSLYLPMVHRHCCGQRSSGRGNGKVRYGDANLVTK